MKISNISGFVSLVSAVLMLVLGLSGTALAFEGDLKEDGYINWLDVNALADKWLNDCNLANNWCDGADIDYSSDVDFGDFALLATYWRQIASPDPNLIGLWRLDESAGSTAYDASGKENNGTLIGNVAWAPASGQFGGAASFYDTGNDEDQIEIPFGPEMTAQQGTVALWFKLDSDQPGRETWLFGSQNYVGSGNRTHLYKQANFGTIYLRLGEMTNLYTGLYASADTWYHIAFTWDQNDVDPNNGDWVAYKNGVQAQNGTYAGLKTLSATANIGNNGDEHTGDRNVSFAGLIDDVGMWNEVLDAGKVVNVYLNGIPDQVYTRAYNPDPEDNGAGVAWYKKLSWSPGDYADSHDVYFGTNESDVNNADNSWPVATGPNDPNVYKGNQEPNIYDPCELDLGTTYYWRIDEANGVTVCKGHLWSFTTVFGPPGKASDPSPADEANGVSIFADLSWTAGADTSSHEVYFGTDYSEVYSATDPNTPPGRGRHTAATFEPGAMDHNTPYYWRIDEVGPCGTTTGDVWSFTTGLPDAPVANFMVIPTSGWDIYYKPEFVSKSTGDINDYLWEFGDTQTSTDRAPNHQYSSAGTYTVTLTVSGPGGSDSMTKTDHITVNDFNDYPYADYNITEPNQNQWWDALDDIETAGGGRILFGFSNDTIYVNDRYDFFGNNLIVDGQDKNVKFYYNGPDDCSQTEGQDTLIRMHGNDNIFRNVDFDRFPDGVHIRGGNRNLIENCNVNTICEDAMSMNGGDYKCYDCIMRNCSYGASDDKAVMVNNGGRGVFRNLSFTDSTQPIRCTGSTGEYVIRHCNVGGESNSFRHSGGSPGQIVYVEENTVNAKRGIRVYDSAQAIIRHNTFTGGNYHGVYVFGSAKARLEHNNIQNFTQGGVMVQNTAQVDAGGGSVSIDGSSAAGVGDNTIQSNSPYDLINQTTSTVEARFNYWDYTTIADVLLYDVDGSAEVDPLGTP